MTTGNRGRGAVLEPGGYDVVMCRHVLAHNGGREAAIVAHLAPLAAADGCVYLVDAERRPWLFPGVLRRDRPARVTGT